MHIRQLHHTHNRLRFLKAWYFLVPAVIFGILAVYGLRGNYSTMVELREAVYVADRQDGDVEKALNDLRAHVHGHMNTNLASGSSTIKPPIQLKNRYDKLVAAEEENIKAANRKVSEQGERACAQRFPAAGFNAPRVACIQEYVSANSVKQGEIPDSLYKFDFISPRWSPDLAGISIVLSAVFILMFAGRALLERYMLGRLNN